MAARVQSAIGRIQGAGSRDRRLYRETIYTWFRYREWIDAARAVDPVLAGRFLIVLADTIPETIAAKSDLPESLAAAASPGPLAARAALLSSHLPDQTLDPAQLEPDWLASEFPAGPTTRLPHTLPRPPIWLRALSGETSALVGELRALGLHPEILDEIPGAFTLPTDSKIEPLAAYRSGRLEIQDIGSQAILHHVAPTRAGSWLDACAGAGGKSLQLAGLVGPEGTVTAIDRRTPALAELGKRAERCGLTHIRCLSQKLESAPRQAFDGVLVDAPCSGSGTWRRHPFLRHQTNPATLRMQAERQLRILSLAARCVRPGGRLVYATCSLCHTENEAVIEGFLRHHPAFRPGETPNPLSLYPAAGPGHYILPERFNGDGFYVAILQRETPA